MVASESEILPSPAGSPLENDGQLLQPDDLENLIQSSSRSSRPHLDDSWLDLDQCLDSNAPTDMYQQGKWKEKYKDLDEILVNGASRRQWTRVKEEIRQILKQCESLIGRDSLRCEDFSQHFHGINSPLFEVYRKRLGMNHHQYLMFMSTCMRLSANQWSVAKLYDSDHPQLNLERCMEREEFTDVWKRVSTCGLPKTREDSANGEIPLWEEMQNKFNEMSRKITNQGRSGRQDDS